MSPPESPSRPPPPDPAGPAELPPLEPAASPEGLPPVSPDLAAAVLEHGPTLLPTASSEPGPAREWSVPLGNPDRASRRRTRPGHFGTGVLVPVLLGVVGPGLAVVTLALGGPGEGAPPALSLDVGTADALDALRQVQTGVSAHAVQGQERIRLETRRAAVRGAMLVEQEIKRLQLEARLQAPGPDPAAPVRPPNAALEPFLGRAGLTSPADASEGEVVLDAAHHPLAGTLPEAFAALQETAPGAGQDAGDRTAFCALVRGTDLRVLAVRPLPQPMQQAGLERLQGWLPRVESLGRQVQTFQDAAAGQQRRFDGQRQALGLAALVAAVLGGLLAWRGLRRHVVEPYRDLREQLERVRAGGKPVGPQPGAPLEDLLLALADVAERLGERRALLDAQGARNAVLDHVLEACQRAQRGDLTARPPEGPGTEGLVATAVGQLLETLESRALRLRALAARVVSAMEESQAASSAPTAGTAVALEGLRQRLDGLLPLAGLLRAVGQRLNVLADQAGAAPAVAGELRKLSSALMSRVEAVSTLLTELAEAAGALQASLAAPRPAHEAWARARQWAEELAHDSRAPRVDAAFPALVAALRDQPQEELRQDLQRLAEAAGNDPAGAGVQRHRGGEA